MEPIDSKPDEENDGVTDEGLTVQSYELLPGSDRFQEVVKSLQLDR